MKLSIATAVLAQRVIVEVEPVDASASEYSPSALLHRMRRMQSVLSASSTANGKRRSVRGTATNDREVFSLRDQIRGSSASTGRERDNVFLGILKNLQLLQENMECDPTAANGAFNSDMDVGILACGPGRYCVESSDSSLGGLCALHHGKDTGNDVSQRYLQDEESSIIDDLQYACDYAYLIGYDCACDLDSAQYSGTASCSSPPVCSTYPSACNVNSTDCRSDSYSVNVLSPGTWETELCIEFTEPYEQKTCYSTTMIMNGQDVQPECSITFEGEPCNLCTAYSIFEAAGSVGNETYLSEICYAFDCSNTAAGSVGNTCDFPVSSMSVYLDTYGCPACNVCGVNGTMMAPETTVRILNNTYECGYIQDVSMMGFFSEGSCQYFSSAVEIPCECDNGVKTEAPTSQITDNVTESTNTTLSPTNETDPSTNPPSEVAPEQVCTLCPNGTIVDVDAFVVVPGQSDQVTCGELEEAGLEGSIPSAACSNVQTLAAVPCCGKAAEPSEEITPGEICNPCGPNKEITNLDGMVSIPQQGMFTCNELAIMGRVAEENEDWCVLIRPFVQTPCGCQSTVPTEAPTSSTPVITQTPESGNGVVNFQDSSAYAYGILCTAFGMLCTWVLAG